MIFNFAFKYQQSQSAFVGTNGFGINKSKALTHCESVIESSHNFSKLSKSSQVCTHYESVIFESKSNAKKLSPAMISQSKIGCYSQQNTNKIMHSQVQEVESCCVWCKSMNNFILSVLARPMNSSLCFSFIILQELDKKKAIHCDLTVGILLFCLGAGAGLTCATTTVAATGSVTQKGRSAPDPIHTGRAGTYLYM